MGADFFKQGLQGNASLIRRLTRPRAGPLGIGRAEKGYQRYLQGASSMHQTGVVADHESAAPDKGQGFS
jgi:hypothetical protein